MFSKPLFLLACLILAQSTPYTDYVAPEEITVKRTYTEHDWATYKREIYPYVDNFIKEIKSIFVPTKYDKIDLAKITDREKRCLALNVYHEARGESVKGQEAVILVTLNRVLSKKYPSTICRVVYQRWQFSWTMDRISDKPHERVAWYRCQQLVERMLANAARTEDFTQNALWYHADYIKPPRWSYRLAKVTQIDRHIFYRQT